MTHTNTQIIYVSNHTCLNMQECVQGGERSGGVRGGGGGRKREEKRGKEGGEKREGTSHVTAALVAQQKKHIHTLK